MICLRWSPSAKSRSSTFCHTLVLTVTKIEFLTSKGPKANFLSI